MEVGQPGKMMLLLIFLFIGLFGSGLYFMETCRVRLAFFQEVPMAFLLGLTFHFFLSIVCSYFISFQCFAAASVVTTCIGFSFLVWKFFIKKKEQIPLRTEKAGFDTVKAIKVLLGAFLIFTAEYLLICKKEIILATRNEGVIYEDFINLVSHAKTILDSSRAEGLVNHGGLFSWNQQVLTNHFASFFINGTNQDGYFLAAFCLKLFSFLLVIWTVAIVSDVFWGKTLSWVQQIFLIVSTLNIEFLLSGTNLTLLQLFFDYSFSLQLSVLSLMMAYVYVIFFSRSQYSIGTVLVFLGLFITAMLFNLSAIIVLPIWGITTLFSKLNRFHRIEFSKLWIMMGFVALLAGGILFNRLALSWKDISYPFFYKPVWFEVLVGLASIVSFRLLLIYKDSNRWLFIFLLLLMALFIATNKEQAVGFYLPILVLLTFFAVGKWMHVQNKGLKYATLIVILCSMYPINTVFRIGSQESKASKYPIHYLN